MASMEPAVRLAEVAITRGGHRVCSGLSLSLLPGQMLAITGDNGSGKSSLLAAIEGALRPGAGSVEVFGAAPSRFDPRVARFSGRDVFTAEERMTGRELVTLGAVDRLAAFKGLSEEKLVLVESVMDRLWLASVAERPAGKASGGERALLRFAQVVVGRPRLLLCDDLGAFDLNALNAVVSCLRDLMADGGAVVVATSGDGPVSAAADVTVKLGGGKARVVTG